MHLLFAAVLFSSTVAHAAPKLAKIAEKNKGKTLAVVSISANNWGNSLQGWNKANTTEVMGTQLNIMLEYTEQLFAQDWEIIDSAAFVSKPEFQALAGEQREVGLPFLDGSPMPLFSKSRKQLVKARLDEDVSKQLASVTGADYLLVIYSEWAVATGKFVKTSKSLAKNVVSIYDANGKQVYKGRNDAIGDRTLGAMGRVVVNEDTIDQWVVAYKKGVETLFNKGRK